jgi:hypothetical protein
VTYHPNELFFEPIFWIVGCRTRLYSPKCSEVEFYEVRRDGVLRSSALSWCSDVFCALEHIHSPHTGVSYLRYVASRRRVKAQDRSLSSS